MLAHHWLLVAPGKSASGPCSTLHKYPFASLGGGGGVIWGHVHICFRYTTPGKNVLETSSRYTSVQIASTVKLFLVPLRSDLKSAHISVCAVWLIVYTLRNVWDHSNNALSVLVVVCVLSPAQLEHVSPFHIVQTSFRRRTKGSICSENMLWPCSSWNCSSGNTTL